MPPMGWTPAFFWLEAQNIHWFSVSQRTIFIIFWMSFTPLFPDKILDRVFQFLPCFELNGIGCLDLDGLAGAGIPAFAGFSADFRECAESDQGDLSVLLSSAHL